MGYPYRSGGQAWPVNKSEDRIAGKLRRDHGGNYDAGHAEAQILLIEPPAMPARLLTVALRRAPAGVAIWRYTFSIVTSWAVGR
jgi:hypothetical protein